MKSIPNILSITRGIAAILLLLCPVFGIYFWVLYVWAGLSDMLDGCLARKLNATSRRGELIDSIADLMFVMVCFIVILPEIVLPRWLWIWIAFIVLIKLVSLIMGLVRHHRLEMPHTIANKITGGMLFLFPIAIQFIPITIPAILIAAVATFAAVQEFFSTINH